MAEELDLGGPFAIAVAREGDTITLVVSGELDLQTASRLEDSLDPPAPGGRLLLDLRSLSFMDSSGVRVLMSMDVRSRAEGWTFVIVRGPGPVQRVLDLCRVSERVLTVRHPADAGW